MTAIFGLIRSDGAPATTDELRAMGDAIAYWGPEGRGVWLQDGAGLGQLLAHNTPESVYERGPIVGDDGVIVVAAARLDNRDELFHTLDIETDRARTTDSQLIAAAFRKWAHDAPRRLYGDWAFAAWDPNTRRLFLARDHYGNTALYYYCDARTFAFASSRKALFALPQVPRTLNEMRLAQILVGWVPDGATTVHEDIFRLPPAHSLAATAGALAIERYWKLEEVADVKLPSDDAYVERFLELYGAAVRARLRSVRPVATTLSSGLDSGSVAALAAREMKRRGETLSAFTAVSLFPEIERLLPHVATDEWPLAHAVAAWCGNIDHHAVIGEHVTPLAAMERSLWLHDEPVFVARHVHWNIALLEQCREHGCGALLTGQLGNGGVSWAGDGYRTLGSLMAGRWIDAWKSLRAAKQSAGSWFHVTRAQLVSPLAGLARGFAFRRGLPSVDLWKHRIVNFRFARRLCLVERMRAGGYGPSFRKIDIRAQRMQILLPDIHPIGAFWSEMGAGYQMEVRDPTADARLLEFCIGVPDDQFAASGRDRWLMRRAMEGLLPPEVQWNTTAGRQGADLPLRLRADARNVDGAIAEIAASRMSNEYLDIPLMQQRWASMQGELGPSAHDDASILARSILVGRFLAGF